MESLCFDLVLCRLKQITKLNVLYYFLYLILSTSTPRDAFLSASTLFEAFLTGYQDLGKGLGQHFCLTCCFSGAEDKTSQVFSIVRIYEVQVAIYSWFLLDKTE